MPRPRPPFLSVVLTALRNARGWTEQDLAKAAGISARMVSLYERERQPAREKLESFVNAMGYGPEAIDCMLFGLQRAIGPAAVPSSPVDPVGDDERRIRQAAARVGLVAVETTEARLLQVERTRRATHARHHAADLWERLAPCTAAERSLLVKNAREFQTWALAERLCAESEAALCDTDRAAELAELAVRAGTLAPTSAPRSPEIPSPEPSGWRARLTGYTLAFLANARRAQGDLPAADETLAQAWALWREGETSDRGVLAAWRLPYFEALLRRDQERLDEALIWLDRAAALDAKSVAGRLLSLRASILARTGDEEGASAALREALPQVVAERESQLTFALHFNLAATSCRLGRHAEAAMLLPRVSELAVALHDERELARVRRLEEVIAAGLSRVSKRELDSPLLWSDG